MKRLVLVTMVILLMSGLIIVGCTSEESTQAPVTTTVTASTTVAPPQPVELSFAYWIPPAIPIARLGWEAWGHEIEEATDGLVKIKFFGGAAMGEAANHYDLCVSGTADIVNFVPEFTPGRFPLTSSYALPLLFPSSEITAGAFWDFHQKYTLDSEMGEIKLLAVSPTAPHQLLNNIKQVKTLEDLQGMKIVATSPTQTKILEKLGAAPVFMPEGEVYTSLERGLVDGRLHQWDGAVVWKGMEVTEYRTGNINVSLDVMHIAMNKDKWNSLHPDIQNIITGATELLWSRHLGMVFDRANMQNLEVLKEYDANVGNPEIYYLPDEERQKWVAAVMPYWEEWVADMESQGLPGQAVLDDLQKWVKQYQEMWE